MRFGILSLAAGTLFLAATTTATAEDQKWGTVKGQVIFGGDKIPPRKVLTVDKNQAECLAKKKQLLSEELVVDEKTKGVKWAYVWLIDAGKDLKKPLPVHPTLAKAPEKVVVDQPCCMFEPYALALREGQTITFKNSMDIAHNVKVDGSGAVGNPQINQLIPAKQELNVGPFKAQPTAIPVGCTIHPWMSGHVRVFNHPYFFVTGDDGKFEIKNAPAGKYRLVIWHPGTGWVVGDKGPDKYGVEIEIKPDGTTDLGPYKVMPEAK